MKCMVRPFKPANQHLTLLYNFLYWLQYFDFTRMCYRLIQVHCLAEMKRATSKYQLSSNLYVVKQLLQRKASFTTKGTTFLSFISCYRLKLDSIFLPVCQAAVFYLYC